MSGRFVTASTEDVPRDKRRDYWADVFAQVHIRMDIAPLPDIDLSASLVAVFLDDVSLVQVTATAHGGRFRRRSRPEQDEERCLLVAMQRGRMILRQNAAETPLGPGDMALLDPRATPEYSVPEAAAFLGTSVPRSALTERVGGLERLAAGIFPRDAPMQGFTHHYLERLLALAPKIATAERFRLRNHLLDLIAITIGQPRGRETGGSSYKAALLHRIKAFVEEHLHDQGLDIGAVAEKFRVSPRYVSQLFRAEATTFNGFTRQRRLERCRRLLELSRANAPSIGEIAVSVGFGSQAYLNKAFKRSFGTTPGDYRRAFQSRLESST